MESRWDELDDLRSESAAEAPAGHITDQGLMHLSGLKHLRFVRLNGAKISSDGIERFKQSLPNCEVER